MCPPSNRNDPSPTPVRSFCCPPGPGSVVGGGRQGFRRINRGCPILPVPSPQNTLPLVCCSEISGWFSILLLYTRHSAGELSSLIEGIKVRYGDSSPLLARPDFWRFSRYAVLEERADLAFFFALLQNAAQAGCGFTVAFRPLLPVSVCPVNLMYPGRRVGFATAWQVLKGVAAAACLIETIEVRPGYALAPHF